MTLLNPFFDKFRDFRKYENITLNGAPFLVLNIILLSSQYACVLYPQLLNKCLPPFCDFLIIIRFFILFDYCFFGLFRKFQKYPLLGPQKLHFLEELPLVFIFLFFRTSLEVYKINSFYHRGSAAFNEKN